MSETPREWKSSRVLKVGGVFARQGVFTGHSPDLNPDGKPEFKENVFTSNVLDRIVANYKKDVPIFINHHYGTTSRGEPVGRSFKVGESPDRDSVSHEGFVWDLDAQKKIIEEGYTISPEFDIQYDPQGNIVDAILSAIVYVNNPAIGGTGGQASAMCFSRGPTQGGDYMSGEQPPAGSPPGGEQQPPAAPNNVPPAQPPQQPAPPANPPVNPPTPPAAPQVTMPDANMVVQFNALAKRLQETETKLAQYDNVVPGLITQNEQMKTQQLGVIANSLKELGIDTPEALVEGLPIDAKIKALSQLQEKLAKTMPMVKPPETMSAIAERAAQNKALFNQALQELGLTEEVYNRVMNGGKINV